MEKVYKIFKTTIFIILGILVLIFNEQFMANEGDFINLGVGIVMLIYGFDSLGVVIYKKEIKKDAIKFFNALINILLGITMIFFIEGNALELVIACVIWSVWSVMREGEEIHEKVMEELSCPITCVINLIESLVVIVFSIMLICEPGEHHAHTHVILLGIELILEVIWPLLAKLETKIFKKR